MAQRHFFGPRIHTTSSIIWPGGARTMIRTTRPALSCSRRISSGRAILDPLGIPRAPFPLLSDDQRPRALTLRIEVGENHPRNDKARRRHHHHVWLPRLLGDTLGADDFQSLRLGTLFDVV